MQALKLQHTHLDCWVWFVHFICIIIGCFDLPSLVGCLCSCKCVGCLCTYKCMEEWSNGDSNLDLDYRLMN